MDVITPCFIVVASHMPNAHGDGNCEFGKNMCRLLKYIPNVVVKPHHHPYATKGWTWSSASTFDERALVVP